MRYDKTDAVSIIRYAKQLKGKTLRQACGSEAEQAAYKGLTRMPKQTFQKQGLN